MPDLLQPNSTGSNHNSNLNNKASNVGATWTNSGSLNIDLDNLMGSKKGKGGPAPTMNQLKTTSNNTSPEHQGMPSVMSPITPTAINFPATAFSPTSLSNVPMYAGQQPQFRNIPPTIIQQQTSQKPIFPPTGLLNQTSTQPQFNANFNNQFNAFQ